MTLTQIEYALAVAKHLSFQKAAKACHVAQPSLSTQLKKLEDQLGVTLFQRSTNTGVSITEVGRQAIEQMQIILNEIKKLEGICSDHHDALAGTVKLGIVPTIGPYLVPLFWSKFRQLHPGVQIEFFEEPTKQLLDGLKTGRLDVGIISPPKEAPDFIVEKVIYYEPFVVYASNGHPILDLKDIKSPDLAKYDVIAIDENHCMREQVLAACGKANDPNAGGGLKSGGLNALISLVDAERGFTLLPILAASILSDQQRQNGIRAISAKPPSRKVSLVYNRNQVRRKFIEELFRCIRESDLPKSVSLI